MKSGDVVDRELDKAGLKLLKFLVARLPSVRSSDPRTFVGYKKAHDELGLPRSGPWGKSLESQGLASLAGWAFTKGVPAITGLVVDTETLLPGDGYFRVYGLEKSDSRLTWWVAQIEAAKKFDWTPYISLADGADNEAAIRPFAMTASELGNANVWRLVAHHESGEQALKEMMEQNVLAVGWSDVGDLNQLLPSDASAIAQRISLVYPDLENAQLGGPSLWSLYRLMRPGDLVIVTVRSHRKCVFEVIGNYHYAEFSGVQGYRHLRPATLTGIDADELWRAVGSNVAAGENIRWTLARCTEEQRDSEVRYREGDRYEVRSTAIERSPAARDACLSHYGYRCAVCGFDFATEFGEIGEGYIHVHHRSELSLSQGPRPVDPVRDLVPVCPNCHAMLHRERPAITVEELARRREAQRRGR